MDAFMNSAEVAKIIGCKPDAINAQAQLDPSKLGFPVCVMGHRVRVPRQAFAHWLRYGNAPISIDVKESNDEQQDDTDPRR